jgi:serine/threonine protein kinase
MDALAQVEDENNGPDIILLNRFKIIYKISQGGFGKIYKCKDVQSNKSYIVKINSDIDINDNEFKIAQKLSGTPGFPKVEGHG